MPLQVGRALATAITSRLLSASLPSSQFKSYMTKPGNLVPLALPNYVRCDDVVYRPSDGYVQATCRPSVDTQVHVLLIALNGTVLRDSALGSVTSGGTYGSVLVLEPTTEDVVVTGVTTGTFPGQQAAAASGAAFAFRLTRNGTLKWVNVFGPTSGSSIGNRIALSTDLQSVYVVGTCNAAFDSQVYGTGSLQMFATRVNLNGTRVWSRITATSTQDKGFVAMTYQGGVVAGGYRVTVANCKYIEQNGTTIWSYVSLETTLWIGTAQVLDQFIYVSGHVTGTYDGIVSNQRDLFFFRLYRSNFTRDQSFRMVFVHNGDEFVDKARIDPLTRTITATGWLPNADALLDQGVYWTVSFNGTQLGYQLFSIGQTIPSTVYHTSECRRWDITSSGLIIVAGVNNSVAFIGLDNTTLVPQYRAALDSAYSISLFSSLTSTSAIMTLTSSGIATSTSTSTITSTCLPEFTTSSTTTTPLTTMSTSITTQTSASITSSARSSISTTASLTSTATSGSATITSALTTASASTSSTATTSLMIATETGTVYTSTIIALGTSSTTSTSTTLSDLTQTKGFTTAVASSASTSQATSTTNSNASALTTSSVSRGAMSSLTMSSTSGSSFSSIGMSQSQATGALTTITSTSASNLVSTSTAALKSSSSLQSALFATTPTSGTSRLFQSATLLSQTTSGQNTPLSYSTQISTTLSVPTSSVSSTFFGSIGSSGTQSSQVASPSADTYTGSLALSNSKTTAAATFATSATSISSSASQQSSRSTQLSVVPLGISRLNALCNVSDASDLCQGLSTVDRNSATAVKIRESTNVAVTYETIGAIQMSYTRPGAFSQETVGQKQISINQPFNQSSMALILAAIGVFLLLCGAATAYYCRAWHRQNRQGAKSVSVNTTSDMSSNITAVVSASNATTSTMQTAIVTSHELSVPSYLHVDYGTHFKQEQEIAHGAMGTVCHVHVYTGTELAKRVGENQVVGKFADLPLNLMSTDKQNAFYQEVALHWVFRDTPGIARIFAYTTSPNATILMQYYALGSLQQYVYMKKSCAAVTEFSYSKRQILSLLLDCTRAFQAMHQRGVVHCDIKPANILLEYSTNDMKLHAIITDFGVARALSSRENLVTAFQVSRLNGLSLSYAPGEAIHRLRTGYKETDPQVWERGDVFSVAMLLKEMITRRVPW